MVNFEINTQELQDKTAENSNQEIIFSDSMGVLYKIVRYKPNNAAQEVLDGEAAAQ